MDSVLRQYSTAASIFMVIFAAISNIDYIRMGANPITVLFEATQYALWFPLLVSIYVYEFKFCVA